MYLPQPPPQPLAPTHVEYFPFSSLDYSNSIYLFKSQFKSSCAMKSFLVIMNILLSPAPNCISYLIELLVGSWINKIHSMLDGYMS